MISAIRILKKVGACVGMLAIVCWATPFDMAFYRIGGELVYYKDSTCFRADGSIVSINAATKSTLETSEQDVRIRIISDNINTQKRPIVQIQRPVLLIDGINLKPKQKTLDMFYYELDGTKKTGKRYVVSILGALKYTPILVQFGASATQSMQYNSETFEKLLTFISNNIFVKWGTATADKYSIIGFSQGGVLGRYGAYLYDKSRSKLQPGVRLLITVDSPHQGAVLPRSLLATLDFWVRAQGNGGEEGQANLELMESPAVHDLLYYNTEMETDDTKASEFKPNLNSFRWLFNDYRNAAKYKGFPVVMISNGKLSGARNYPLATKYYELGRDADWSTSGNAWARVTNKASYSNTDTGVYAYNHIYKYTKTPIEWPMRGSTEWDMVQGSVYPFNQIMYKTFYEAFKDQIPESFETDLKRFGINYWSPDLKGYWKWNSLNQDSSTFIPTTSALDILCNDQPSVLDPNKCAFTMNEKNVDWKNPVGLSTAKAIYPIDALHPRGAHTSGQYHVFGSDPVDYWRIFCELMKSDDIENGAFVTKSLRQFITVDQNCLDQASIPNWFLTQYSVTPRYRYTKITWIYNEAQRDRDEADFSIPGGWNPVATMHGTRAARKGDVIEVTMQASSKFNWLKLDFVLLRKNDGTGWLQLGEKTVIADGHYHVYTWKVPDDILDGAGYVWGRLIMNSLSGGDVKIHKIRVAPDPTSPDLGVTAYDMTDSLLYPGANAQWAFGDWGHHNQNYMDESGTWLKLDYDAYYDGAFWDASTVLKTDNYKHLVVEYKPQTCRNTIVYFDERTYWKETQNLPYREYTKFHRMGSYTNRKLDKSKWVEVIPLSNIEGPEGKVHRLYFQTEPFASYQIIDGVRLTGPDDCYIQKIYLSKN